MTSGPWIALVSVLVSTSAAAADPACKPSARVTGEGVVVRAIEVVLRARGIDVAAVSTDQPAFVGSPCRGVIADITIGEAGRLVVAVTDEEGRHALRTAEDTEAAATVIESWARRDVVDPLLLARRTFAVDSSARTSTRASLPASRAQPRFIVGGGGDVGVSSDGGVWAGGHVRACATLGSFCIGGALRYALDTEQTGDAATLDSKRTALAVTFTGERPIRRGRFSLSPGVGIGLASVTATRPAENEEEQASALHGRVGIAAAFEVTHAWSVRLDLDGEIAPFARQRLGDADGVDRQLAASPTLQTWLGLALTYGGL
jgi:hypothetical protein